MNWSVFFNSVGMGFAVLSLFLVLANPWLEDKRYVKYTVVTTLISIICFSLSAGLS